MKVHEAIAKALNDLGVNTLFGLVGDANMYLVDSYVKQGNRYIGATNENSALLMASAFSSTTGLPGVATITQMAVGVTVPALLENVRGRVPLVLLAGDTPVNDRNGLQNIDQASLVRGTGAGFELMRNATTVVEDVRTALRRALAERRPIVLDIPLDMQWQETEYAAPLPVLPPLRAGAAHREALEDAVGVIAAARRPVVLAGAGAATPDGRAALLRLAERIGAPVATTLQAKDLFRGDPFNLGICGTLSRAVGLDAIVNSDCLVVFGASLTNKTTDNFELLVAKTLVQCDLDPSAFARDNRVDAALVGDVVATADALIEILDEAEVPSTGYRAEALAARLAAQEMFDGTNRRTAPNTIHLWDALAAVDSMFGNDRVLVVDAGRFMVDTLKSLEVNEPRDYVHTTHIGAIGMGTPAAIGAAVGVGPRPTLLITGDGGFMFGGLGEFHTAIRLGLNLVVAVMNDGAYGAEHVAFRQRGMDASITMNDWPEFESVIRAMGGEATTVRTVDDVEHARKLVAERSGPMLVDFRIDPDSVPDPGFRRH